MAAARLPELLKLLDLERIEDNLFRGGSRDVGAPQVFGGQVLAQASRGEPPRRRGLPASARPSGLGSSRQAPFREREG